MRLVSTTDVRIATPSTLEGLNSLAADAERTLGAVLDRSRLIFHDINAGGGVFFFGWSPWRWRPLEKEDQGLVKRAEDARQRWCEQALRAIKVGDAREVAAFERDFSLIERVLDRTDSSWSGAPGSSIDEIRVRVGEMFGRQRERIARLPTAQGAPRRVLVPDTNSFLARPDVENWRLDGGAWTIVAVPQVIRELDEKKRHTALSEKADKVIRRFNEYGRRGDTLHGDVPIAGRLRFHEVAVEADMDETLPRLRRGSGDDQLLASALELRWQDLQASVTILTGDRNLRNKARFARMSCLGNDLL